MVVISIPDQSDWHEAGLAKRQLAWHKKQYNPLFDFKMAIEKEENILRSFFNKARDQAA